MKIRVYVIEVSGVRWMRRAAVVAGLIGFAGVASGDVLHHFAPHTAAKAQDVEDNFVDLDARVTAIDGRVGAIESLRMETAVISANCTLTSKSSPWLTVQYMPAGSPMNTCRVVYEPGVFSAAPTCTATSYGVNGAAPAYIYAMKLQGIPTATYADFVHEDINTNTDTGEGANEPFGLICVGPK